MAGEPFDDRERRAAVRAFARRHHPDIGGDPATFVAGLARLRARTAEPDRGEAPVVFVTRRAGLAGLADRLRTWWRRRRRPPRVR
ncbi:hypothetical protein ACFS2C_08685 [Prauserella oleivorans]|uniref:J domain-containing protein n=1 Tax=Prauserella oleivorans TaxID=1478153 RepID=A0ABW5W699_9PSEU